MSKKENKILDPLTVILMEPSSYCTAKSIVNHADGNITKDDGRSTIKDAFDYIAHYASFHKFSFEFTEADFQDICERVGIAYIDKCHEIRKAYGFDVLKPHTLLISLLRTGDFCGIVTVELLSDLRHYHDGKLISVTNYHIQFNFTKATLVDGKKLVTNIYPSYCDSHEDR